MKLKFENPFTGQKSDLFDLTGMFSKVLGVVIMFFVIATGQNLAKKIEGLSNSRLDTTIDPLVKTQTVNTRGRVIV